MINIKLDKSFAKIEGEKIPKDIIDKVTRARVPGFQFSRLYHKKVWDGYVHLFNVRNSTFPIGLLDYVTEALDKNKFEYLIDTQDLSTWDLPNNVLKNWYTGNWKIPLVAGKYTLHDYQVEAIKAFLDHNRKTPYRGILRLAVGMGKTVIGATISKIVNAKTLFLVKGKNLKKQNYDNFKDIIGEDLVGTIDADEWNPKLVTVCSIDTISSRIKNPDYEDEIEELFKDVVLIISDECHGSTAKNWQDVIKKINAPMCLGLSGTPFKKEDNKDLILRGLTGPVLIDYGAEKGREEGTTSDAHLLAVVVDSPKIPTLGYRDAVEALIINNVERHQMITSLIKKYMEEDKTILVLAGNSVPLGTQIHNNLLLFDWVDKTAYADGSSKKDHANNCFDKLKNGELKCLVVSTIADQGIDIPAIDVLMSVGGGKSFVKTIQRPGRAVRLKKSGGAALIVDFFDITNKYLKKHSLQRLKYYKEENTFTKTDIIKMSEYLSEKL